MKNEGFCDPEVALRQMCAAPAAVFGAELLAQSSGTAIPFRAFVRAAKRLVAGSPDEAARWLAALVALEIVGQGRGRAGPTDPAVPFDASVGLEPGCN